MKTLLRFAVLVAVTTVLACGPSSRAGDPKPATGPSNQASDSQFVAVAGWLNKPEVDDKDGRRVQTILNEHKIKNAAVGSAGMTLNVMEAQAAEARKLLAKAILREGLRIVLFDEHGKTVSTETVLGRQKQ